jgi:hypothetical protein
MRTRKPETHVADTNGPRFILFRIRAGIQAFEMHYSYIRNLLEIMNWEYGSRFRRVKMTQKREENSCLQVLDVLF